MTDSSEYSEGGYDYEFVDTLPDTLVCKICHYPSREPHLTVCCGHTFCNSCIKNVKKSTFLSDACPMCRAEQFTTVPNKQNERAVLSLHVLCVNTERGCDWIGEVNNITSHLKNSSGCKFEDVHCPNSCGETFERQYLASHAEECPCRLINCQYCHIAGEYQFIEGSSHKEQCCKFPVACPNNCEVMNVPREHLKEHMKVCPVEIVQCQYHNVGCKAKVARKDLVKHDEEKTNEHLLLVKSLLIDTQNKLSDTEHKLDNTQNNLADTQSKLAETQHKLDNTQNRLDDTLNKLGNTQGKLADTECKLAVTQWKFDNMQSRFGDTESKLQSMQSRFGDTQSKLQSAQSKLQSTQDKLQSTQSKLANTQHKLDTTQTRLDDVEDKLDDAEQRLGSAEEEIEDNYTEVLDEIEEAKLKSNREIITVENRISELEATLKQKTKLIDMLFGEWAIGIHTRAAKLSSCNQLLPVIVKVPDFTINKSNKVDWYSSPFFTHHNGYKMRLNGVPAGWSSSEGLYMSVYLYIMDGPFDHLLKWQLRGKFQVTLLNQISDSKHHSVSYRIHADRNQSSPFWYCEEFVPYEELHVVSATCQYIKDDCLFFEVCRLS